MTTQKTAVVLLNLGGPDSLDAVQPYLQNLFGDPEIIQLPLGFLWQPIFARMVSKKRAPESRENYGTLGGRSPILEETQAQADALKALLGDDFEVVTAMRYWHPFTDKAVDEALARGCTRFVALPLYPHRSRATAWSSVKELRRVLKQKAPQAELKEVCCYPVEEGLVTAWVARIHETLDPLDAEKRGKAHLLFSAHGLPQKMVDDGDPYLAHVQATVAAIMAKLPAGWVASHSLSFQSRATRVKWLEPETGAELARLAASGVRDVGVVPIAFVSEHVETLFELDKLIREPALAAGITGYHRVFTPRTHPALIGLLASQVHRALEGKLTPCGLVPTTHRCPMRGEGPA